MTRGPLKQVIIQKQHIFFFTGLWHLEGGGRNLLFIPRNLIGKKRDIFHNTVTDTNTFDIEQVYSLFQGMEKSKSNPHYLMIAGFGICYAVITEQDF